MQLDCVDNNLYRKEPSGEYGIFCITIYIYVCHLIRVLCHVFNDNNNDGCVMVCTLIYNVHI